MCECLQLLYLHKIGSTMSKTLRHVLLCELDRDGAVSLDTKNREKGAGICESVVLWDENLVSGDHREI